MEIIKLDTNSLIYKDSLRNIRELDIKDDKFKAFVQNPFNLCYMAIMNEEVVGLAWGYIMERMDSENMLYIHSVDVKEKVQNQGIGTKLIEAFLGYAKEHNFRNTFLITDEDNEFGNKLYSKFKHELELKKNLYIFK